MVVGANNSADTASCAETDVGGGGGRGVGIYMEGSMGVMMTVLMGMVVVGVLASLLARLCKGRHSARRQQQGLDEDDFDGWMEKSCAVCIDGSLSPPNTYHYPNYPAMAGAAAMPAGAPVHSTTIPISAAPPAGHGVSLSIGPPHIPSSTPSSTAVPITSSTAIPITAAATSVPPIYSAPSSVVLPPPGPPPPSSSTTVVLPPPGPPSSAAAPSAAQPPPPSKRRKRRSGSQAVRFSTP